MSLGESASVAPVKRVQWVSRGGGRDEPSCGKVTRYMRGGSSVNEAALPA